MLWGIFMRKLDCLLIGYTGNNIEFEKQRLAAVTDKNIDIENPFNLALAYLGTYLHKLDITYKCITSFDDELDLIKEILTTQKISIVAVSTTFCINLDTLRDIVKMIREINPNVKIVFGGHFIAARIKQLDDRGRKVLFKKVGGDILINSFYGEDILGKIILAIKNGNGLEEIDNIFYKDKNGIHITKSYYPEYEINDFNIDWELFADNMGRYIPIRTNVSCMSKCNYCTYSQNAGKYKEYDLEKLEKELWQIKNIGKIKVVEFIDSTFNVPPYRFKEILKMMIRNKFDFEWHSFLRCQFLDEESVSLMRQSGCKAVHLGFESGNQEMLNIMNKGVKIEDYFHGHALLKKQGIITTGLFFIGFPGETFETIKDTINFINTIQPDYYFIQPWMYDHATPIKNYAEKYGLKGAEYNWSHKTMDSETAIKLAKQLPMLIKGSICRNMDVSWFFQLLANGFTVEELEEMEHKLNAIKFRDVIVEKEFVEKLGLSNSLLDLGGIINGGTD